MVQLVGWVLGVGVANPHAGWLRGCGCESDVTTAGGLVWGSRAGTSIDLCGVHKGRLSARLRFACVVCLAVLLCRLSGVRLDRCFGLVLAVCRVEVSSGCV